MTQEDVERIIALRGLDAATAKTIATPDDLAAELQAIRKRGFAIDEEENAIGLRCLAAPILDEHGKPVAAISLSGPTARIGDDLLQTLGEAVREAANQITLGLGGTASTA